MQEIDSTFKEPSGAGESAAPGRGLRRLIQLLAALAVAALAVVALLVLLPPLMNVSRFQRRIVTSISESLGRPVHLDRVSLNLLPLPGFTLEKLVVSEDPGFGSEPIIRADSVRATLRISSLWRRQVEFSTISFTDPSVNLVHRADGRWNLESILVRAAHIDAAPTAQRRAGDAPRFPYIEATGARLNLKMDQEKMPISLTDADFALWLPEAQQFHLRLKGHPARTDTNVTDTGVVEAEGTLERAASLGAVPISLKGEWDNAPLGEVSRMVLGHDAGLRGEMTLTASAQGTVGTSAVQARLQVEGARRADFVPERTLTVDVQCGATSTDAFHGFAGIRCEWPSAASGEKAAVRLTGTVPDVRRMKDASFVATMPGTSAETALMWLRVASSRVPANMTAKGTVSGRLAWKPVSAEHLFSAASWSGELMAKDAAVMYPAASAASLVTGDVTVQTAAAPVPVETRTAKRHRTATAAPVESRFVLAPVTLALGGREPAMLDGRLDESGYTLHLTGMASSARMLALGAALPFFGDGLAQTLPQNRAAGPYRVDLSASRRWGAGQVWTDGTTVPVRGRRR